MATNSGLALVSPPAFREQLERVNRKIAQLVTEQPYGDIQQVFELATCLAEEAIFASTAMQQMPGVDPSTIEPALDFWRSVQQQNKLAAAACSGQNHTLAEALITFAVLQTVTGKMGE